MNNVLWQLEISWLQPCCFEISFNTFWIKACGATAIMVTHRREGCGDQPIDSLIIGICFRRRGVASPAVCEACYYRQASGALRGTCSAIIVTLLYGHCGGQLAWPVIKLCSRLKLMFTYDCVLK